MKHTCLSLSLIYNFHKMSPKHSYGFLWFIWRHQSLTNVVHTSAYHYATFLSTLLQWVISLWHWRVQSITVHCNASIKRVHVVTWCLSSFFFIYPIWWIKSQIYAYFTKWSQQLSGSSVLNFLPISNAINMSGVMGRFFNARSNSLD